MGPHSAGRHPAQRHRSSQRHHSRRGAASTRPNIAALSLVCSHAALVAAQKGTDIHRLMRTLQGTASTLLQDMALAVKANR